MKHKFLACTILSILASGCASIKKSEFSITASDLGVAYYLPNANLLIKREFPTKYLATFNQGESSHSRLHEYFLMLEGLVVICPVWRIAQDNGAKGAFVEDLPSQSGDGSKVYRFLISLTQSPATTQPKPSAKGRIQALDFKGTEWDAVKGPICDNVANLNKGNW